MSKRLLLGFCLGFALAGHVPSSKAIADDDPDTIVYPTTGRSSTSLAKAIGSAVAADVSIVADPDSNTLIIKGSRESVAKTAKLLSELDPRPVMVTMEVVIEVTDPKSPERTKIMDRLQLSTLNNQRAMLQFGQEIPVVVGRQTLAAGRIQEMTKNTQVGTLVSATPRIVDGGLTVEIQIEKSWIESSDGDGESDSSITHSITLQTTVQLEAGKSQALKALASGGKVAREALITVTGSSSKAASNLASKPSPSRAAGPARVEPSARQSKPPSNTTTPPSESRSQIPDNKLDPKYVGYAERIVTHSDKNQDGVLTENEWIKMLLDISEADADKDGRITVEEYAGWMQVRASRQ